jgi:hypothetical protein
MNSDDGIGSFFPDAASTDWCGEWKPIPLPVVTGDGAGV